MAGVPEGVGAIPKVHWLLMYDVVDDYVTRRQPHRADHFAHAMASVERGDLLMGGALDEPADGAVLVFLASSPAVAQAFAEADPYVQNGLVTRWHVRRWRMVIGPGAEAPA